MDRPTGIRVAHEHPDRSTEQVEEQAKERRKPLSMSVGVPLIQQGVGLSENPEALRKRISKSFEDIPQHVNALAIQYGPLLGEQIPEGIAGDSLGEELEAIRYAIVSGVETGTGAAIEHRYMRAKEAPEGFPSWYGIDFHAIEADQKLLQGIREAHANNPAIAGYVANMHAALSEYARHDPSFPSDRWGIVHRNPGDAPVMEVVKIAGFLIAAGAAILTGISALRTKKDFGPPLLYAAIAGLLVPPIRQSIFGTKNEKVLAELNDTMNAPGFKESLHTYDVAGREWRAYAEDVMANPGGTRSFLRALKRHPVDSPHNAELIEEYVLSSGLSAGKERDHLHKMILDGQFPPFAARLMSAKSDDVRAVVLQYIEQGSSRMMGLAQKDAREATRVIEQTAQLNPGGPEYAV